LRRMVRSSLALFWVASALLSGCANPAFMDPIEGRTFIVEERTRQDVWDAAIAVLEAEGRVEAEDYQLGEVRGYAGERLEYSAVLISMNQLYPGEDVYTVSVAAEAVAPLGDDEQVREALIGMMREKLAL